MESDIIIKAALSEMERFFDGNDVCSVKHYKAIGKCKFEARIRHAERDNCLRGTYTIPQITAELGKDEQL